MESNKDTSDSKDQNITNRKNDEKETTATHPLFMYEYLQKLGNRQKQIIENFYHSAIDKSCPDMACDDMNSNGFMCNFLSTLDDDAGQVGIVDGFDQHIVGPRICEYCKSEDTAKCKESCERPKMYFIKRRPPFENSTDGYSKSGELLADLDLCKFSR